MAEPLVTVVVLVCELDHPAAHTGMPPPGVAAKASVQSALSQGHGSVDIVVVAPESLIEDGLSAFVESHRDRVRLIAPGGAQAGELLRVGVEAARGRHVCWLKAGDLADPRRIEAQMKELERTGSDWVTCASRLLPAGKTHPAEDTGDGTLALMAALLSNRRDSATILASREALAAAGGFNPALDCLFEVDLALRLAVRGAAAHIPDCLVRRHSFRPAWPQHAGEVGFIARWLCEETAAAGGIGGGLESLGKIAAGFGHDLGAAMPALRLGLAHLVRGNDLCVGVLGRDGISDAAVITGPMGLPHAQAIKLTVANPLRALSELMARTSARHLLVIDPVAIPDGETLARQLLQAAAEDLDACLPWPDPLVYNPTLNASFLIGALFRRSGLEKISIGLTPDEGRFWSALAGAGRVGALPPAGPIPFRSRRPPEVRDAPPMTPANLAWALIDREWYLATYPDVAEARLDPIKHFMETGWRERRQPNPWFQTAWYVARNASAVGSETNPLLHFVERGAAAGLRPSPGFDIAWYSKHYLDLETPSAEALLHFMTVGLTQGALPYPRLHAQSPAHQDRIGLPIKSSVVPETTVGERDELLEALVDGGWYRSAYGLSRVAPEDAAAHYYEEGWRLGHQPNSWFDSRWYLERYPDASPNAAPLIHYVDAGAAQGCRPHRFFDPEWYSRTYLAGADLSADTLRHFLTIGLASGCVPNSRLATPALARRLRDTPAAQRSALLKRFAELLLAADAAGELTGAADLNLWPLALAEDLPPGAAPVLLLTQAPADPAAEKLAASVLPMEQYPIFGKLERGSRLRLSTQPGGEGVSARFQLPEQGAMLAYVLDSLGCRRAAPLSPGLAETPEAQWIRDAGLPVFANGTLRARTQKWDAPAPPHIGPPRLEAREVK